MILKTCPFCGSNPRFVYRRAWNEWFVACTGCQAHQGSSAEGVTTMKQAADKWNLTFNRIEVEIDEVRKV